VPQQRHVIDAVRVPASIPATSEVTFRPAFAPLLDGTIK
jgi:hypothetical protein